MMNMNRAIATLSGIFELMGGLFYTEQRRSRESFLDF
jgi:hypothetical protein